MLRDLCVQAGRGRRGVRHLFMTIGLNRHIKV
jgi:hypothetical protein